ncbi:MAG: exonuclease SbcCD subunit D [Acidobacteriota bacterium]
MARFLHIADVHLGIKRYNLPDRTGDFFRAWSEVIERFAITRRVDFVLIAGDLFDRRVVEPQAANHAMAMLMKLKEAQIPVVVIEGNHDQHEATSRFSWLRSFSQWGFIHLLEPGWSDGSPYLSAWNEETRKGAYIDIADARIFGSTWYGSTVGNVLPLLAQATLDNRRENATNIMLLHSDIEGQLNHKVQHAISISKLITMRDAVDYLALGHTHKKFDIEGWAYNPGSLEACSIDEIDNPRGAFITETEGKKITTEFITAGQDYFQRPFKRITHEISGHEEPEAVREEVFETLKKHCAGYDDIEDNQKPIIELSLRGQLGFKNSLLRLNEIKERANDEFNLLGLIVNNKTIPKQLAVAVGLSRDISRSERELRVIEDLIRQDARFAPQAAEIAPVVATVKKMLLEGETVEKILHLIEARLFQPALYSPESAFAEGAD